MALTKKPIRIEIYDKEDGGPVNVDIHYAIDNDHPDAVAVGNSRRGIVVRCECPRAAVGTLISNCRIVDDGGWPEGAIALPLPRKA